MRLLSALLLLLALAAGGAAAAGTPAAAAKPAAATNPAASTYSACPFAALAGDISQYPTDWVDTVLEKYPPPKVWEPVKFSKPSSCTPAQYAAIAKDLMASGAGAPALLRAGFHAAGTWSDAGRTGGVSGGWLQFEQEFAFPVNRGIEPAVAAAHKLKTKWPCITFADLLAFGGAIGPELAGGPAIAWYPGRPDALTPPKGVVPFAARMPDGAFNAAAVLHQYLQQGLTLRELVVVTGGGHSIGAGNLDTTGWNGVFTGDDSWPTPGNKYFRDLVGLAWQAVLINSTGRLQFEPVPGQKGVTYDNGGQPLFRLPSDIALRESDSMSYWAKAYALDEARFLREFVRTWQRMLQYGAGSVWTPATSYVWRGMKGTAKDYGPYIAPLTDGVDVPAPSRFLSHPVTDIAATHHGVVNAEPASAAVEKPVDLPPTPAPKAAVSTERG